MIWWPWHMCLCMDVGVGFFCRPLHPQLHTASPHERGWAGGWQDGMSVKAWEKEERREREEEASWARSHRPGNNDPPTGTPAPQWVDHTHAQTLTTTCKHVHKHRQNKMGRSCSKEKKVKMFFVFENHLTQIRIILKIFILSCSLECQSTDETALSCKCANKRCNLFIYLFI